MVFHIIATTSQDKEALSGLLSSCIEQFELPENTFSVSVSEDGSAFGVSQTPALVFEEPVLQFAEILAEGYIPEASELQMLFAGLFGEDECSGGCSGGCHGCSGCGV